MSTNQNEQFSMLPKILNGSIAGIVGVSVIFPLDLVKTRLQNQVIGPNGEKKYKSILDCFKKTYRSDGYWGMYKGSGVNILLVAPEKAIKLAANDMFRHILGDTKEESLSAVRGMTAGGLAGLCQIVITTPMELLKIRMQTHGYAIAQAKQAGIVLPKASAASIALDLVKAEGLFGLYKGVSATALRDVTFSIVYFPLYAAMLGWGPHTSESGDVPFYWSFLSGFVCAGTLGLAVTPFDVIKTRLQVKEGEKKHQHNGVWDAIIKTLKQEGLPGIFKGGTCRVMVLAPLFGIAQMTYYLGVAENLLGMK